MDSTATDREELLRITAETLAQLHSIAGDDLVAGAAASDHTASDVVRSHMDVVIDQLTAALDFARLEGQLLASNQLATAESGQNIPYIPSNQALALMQSAIDEFTETQAVGPAGAFDPSDPGWLSVAWEKLKALFRGKHRFVDHGGDVQRFRESFPTNAVVALFSDWGTGEDTAKRVMSQIKSAKPTHAIHLGDVYYSGTEREIRKRFIDVIDQFGPQIGSCRYLALNSNHEMYSGGHAYFDITLARFNQPASYFNLQNENWQLLGLDTGYEDHGLKDPQKDWLTAQLQLEGRRNILLTHHQLFSPFEERAFGRKLHDKVTPLLGHVHAWFWGHEHKAIIFGNHQGIKARCIGHGAIPARVPYGNPSFPNVPITHIDERPAPGTDDATHGFALLRFQGPHVSVDYIDEFGNTFFNENL